MAMSFIIEKFLERKMIRELHRARGLGGVTREACEWQACSRARAPGVAKLSWRNHVMHRLRAYSMLYVITIKWIMCVQENIELSSMSLRPRLSSSKISGDFSLTYKDIAAIKNCKKLPGDGK